MSSVIETENSLKRKLFEALNSEIQSRLNNCNNDYSKKVFSLLQEKLLTFYNSQNGNRD